MREGLRSRTPARKGSGGGEVVRKKKRVFVKNEDLVSGNEGLVSSIEKKGEVEGLVSGDEVSGDGGVVQKKRVRVQNDEGLVLGDEGLVEPTKSIEKGEVDALVSGDEGLVKLTSSIEKKGDVECASDVECAGEVEALVKPTSSIEKKGGVERAGGVECAGEVEASVKPTSSIEKKGAVECAGDVECVGEVECAVRRGRDLDLNVSLSEEDVDLAENGDSSPMSRLKDGDSNVEAEADKKESEGVSGGRSRLKDGDSNVEVEADKKESEGVSGGRLLRSRSKKGGERISYNEGNDGVFSESDGEHGGMQRVQVKKEPEEFDEVLTDGNKNERVKVKMGGNGKKKLKRKRGRPLKTEIKEKDQLDDQPPRKLGRPRKTELKEAEQSPRKLGRPRKTELKEDDQSPRKLGRPRKTELKEDDKLVDQSPRKLGRPRKTELKEEDHFFDQSPRKLGRPRKTALKVEDQLVDQSPRKRGRPLMTDQQKHLTTVAHNCTGKASREDGKNVLIVTDIASENEVADTLSRRSSGKKLKKKGVSPVRKNKLRKVLKTENNGMASPLASNTVKAPAAAKQGQRRKEQQLVRDKIMECLSAAGWTVDHRPRNGRNYIDAVYVGLDGSTHWSVTLAYKRLKKHYEAGDGEGKLYKPGFKFTPIPEEDFNILTRVVTKSRKGSKVKCVPSGGKGGKRVDGVKRKEKKIKPGSGAGKGKSVKGKMKRKRSLHEEDNTNVTSSNRDRKRHKTQNKVRSTLLVRDATEEVDSEINGYVPYNRKRTVLAWMIDLGTILQNGKVRYTQDRLENASLEGKITGDGIHCGCCNEIITISDFGVHAGSKQSDPLKNIYTEEETSLLQCLLNSWNKQDESELKRFHFVDVAGEDPNDDTCGVCGDGGDLICCDGCPSTFHKSCLDIKKFPSGDWHCVYCCCKFCGLVSGSSNQSVVNDEFTMPALLTCHLCEEKFHISCIEANGGKTDDSRDALFCGNKCQELSERLEMLLGVKHEIEDGFSCSFIRRSDVGCDVSLTKPQMVECNSKLAVSLSIMNECFMPYIDHRSGTNLLRSILYNCGSNFKRLNYSGFITAILERGDEIICVASIRIHGNRLAEMPFIGTRYMYRRQGMCRRLLNAIESALSSLHVELLVIPAISELRETWTSVFGFEPLEQTSRQITKNMNLLVFPHVDLLQKKISKHEIANENLIHTEVSNDKMNLTTYKVTSRNGEDSSGSDCCPKSEKIISVDSGCWHLENSLNKGPDITSNTVQNSKFQKDVTCHAACQAVNVKLVVDNKNTANAGEYVAKACGQVEDKNRQCLSTSCINTEASEGHNVGPLLEVTESCFNEVKVTTEVGLNNNSAEKSAPSGEENTRIDSQVVLRTRESKYSAESNHDSPKISDGCELRLNTDFAQLGCIGSEVYAESVNGCVSHSRPDGDRASGEAGITTNILRHIESQNTTTGLPVSVPDDLQAKTNPGDCQSILVSSGICEKIADAVNETNKASREADADFLSADIEVTLDDKPGSHSRPNGHSAHGEAGLTTNVLMHLESQNITKGFSVTCENNSSVVGVNERNKVSSAADADVFPIDLELVPNNKPGIKESSELAEPDLQVDQTERSNANTASGAALHCTSAGSTSCGSTEGIVLSNQAVE